MATNLEFKGQLQSFDTLTGWLADLNAVFHETVHQIDTYYFVEKTAPNSEGCTPRLKLREAKGITAGWLIYYERPNESTSRYSNYQLCEIAEPEALKSLLTLALGVKVIVEKERQIWMFNHTRIHLDTVADLGTFIELETVFQGQSEAEAVAEHRYVKAVLRLDTIDPIAGSYSDLVLQKS